MRNSPRPEPLRQHIPAYLASLKPVKPASTLRETIAGAFSLQGFRITMSLSTHGTIHWLEIPVINAARAAAFYTSIFRWECTSFGPSSPPSSSSSSSTPANNRNPASTIHMFRKGGTLNGAFIQVPEGCLVQAWGSSGSVDGRVSMAVLTTFAVESIEATLKMVEDLGGRVYLEKTAIGGGMGYLARFVDCEGNLQGIWAQN
ncbi:hypothetical protein KVR01_001451 [Diaporthe batatas]|uniref:uncharacterized protein n=1 Tax=Diaporthe batatas TaxID=748121 RepID=UPI001D03DFF5|nr:uncharacterized protein KVR01_001451 [Diaporthe batatas]KAG8168702.1 hypothetical protein KVR01_001451 [Diaporthe batatas]